VSIETSVRRTGPLGALRALKSAGLAGRADEVRALLAELTDVLDVEAAGRVLSGTAQLDLLAADGGFAEQRIALLGSSTLEPLPNLLTAVLLREGVLPRLRGTGFNQWRFEIMAGAPNLVDLSPRIVACLLDDTAVFETVTDPVNVDEIAERCAQFPAELDRWVDACQQALGGLVVLATIPLNPLRQDRLVDYRSKARLSAAWTRMNAAIADLAATRAHTVVLAWDVLAAHAGQTFVAHRMRHAAGQAYAPQYLRAYAEELGRVARAALGRARKCLVLDLDNTLWGGVVGDDGIGRLRLGGSYPGSAHAELQTLARDLMSQGVMLAIASKNDEALAREAIATHPDMVLRPDSFLAVRANWEPKPANVAAIAEQLNIGVDAMVFVDDNPVERGLMRDLQPAVATVELPLDPAEYAAHVAARGDFNLLSLTDEDRARSAMYQAQAKRAVPAGGAVNLTEHLLSLQSRLTVEPVGPLNLSRVVQLFGKTNQFNLTGRRYGEHDVEQHRAAGTAAFYGARLTDRYGDNGLVAALALVRSSDTWTIENFVLSCRVFARNAEDAIVALILRAAAARGVAAVLGPYVQTPKNSKFAGFYPGLGFTDVTGPGAADASRLFRHDLAGLPELPRWIHTDTTGEVFHAG
jgi:FkbH-like protein